MMTPADYSRRVFDTTIACGRLEGRQLLAANITGISDDTGLSSSDAITTDQTILIHGTATPNSTVQVAQGPFIIGSATANGVGAWTFNNTGTHASRGHVHLLSIRWHPIA